MSEKIAVIDTETTWRNELMSIGAVIADGGAFKPSDKRYYILLPQKAQGGMYWSALYINGAKPDYESSRPNVMSALLKFLAENEVRKIFAYNAKFDYGHLRELNRFEWYDIMRLAAYRRFNRAIPATADCFGTGRLKSGYGVESIYRMLSGNAHYRETHNALFDALDELEIMRMLGQEIEQYSAAKLQ